MMVSKGGANDVVVSGHKIEDGKLTSIQLELETSALTSGEDRALKTAIEAATQILKA